jgi:TonB family protein
MTEFVLHALWQPLAIALAAAAAAWLAGRLDPGARANLWLLAIFLAAIAPAVTLLLPAPAATTAPAFVISVEAGTLGAARTKSIWPIALLALVIVRVIWLCAGLWSIRGLRGSRRVVLTDRVVVPATFGFIRPVIALPRRMWPADVRRAVLAHEWQHVRRHDFAWNLAAEWATLAIWWHPAVRWMKHRWAAEREFACDAAAAARVPAYPRLLLEAARTLTSPAPRLALGLFDSNHFEERLMRLTRPVPFLRGVSARAVGVSAFTLLLASGAFFALRPVVRAQYDQPVYRVGGDVSAPRLLHKVEPQYTEEARNARIEGTVVLAVVVGADGRVKQASVQRPMGSGLDEQALAAVHQWEFQPAYRDGQPVAVNATIEVNFRLL